jgi:Phage tail assembly chaperone protein, TAC
VSEKEFKVGDHVYRAGRMSVFEQFGIASDFRDVLLGLALAEKRRDPKTTDEQFRKSVDLLAASGSAPPPVRERVMQQCLAVTVRRQKAGWAPMIADGQVMFQDVTLSDLVQIMYHVFQHNGLLDFFDVGPLGSSGPTRTETGPVSQTEKTG